ncbi:MAG TPA: hypothetical protein VF903_10330 [Nitrospirota bacterium]
MGKNLLGEVIDTEKEIQKSLEREKSRLSEWLKHIKGDCEAEYAGEEQAVKETLRLSLEKAKQDADIRASDIVQKASREIEKLGALTNEDLSRIVARRLRIVLPE